MRQIATALIVAAALVGLWPLGAQARADGQSRVLCYTAYDADYFYLAAVVQKPHLAGRQKGFPSDPLTDDAIAVFLQTEDQDAGSKRSTHSVEMAVGVAGAAQLYRGIDATPLTDFKDFLDTPDGRKVAFKYGVQARGPLNREGGENNGYTVELAIPWIELGGPPAVGRRMRFNVVSYSAAAGSPPLLSLSTAIKTAADVQNPSLWDEIVF